MARTIQQIAREERFNRQIVELSREHSRGNIHPELKARMSKPKTAEPMYQVFVDIKGESGSLPVSPRVFGVAGHEFCARILEALNAKICLGKLKSWGNPRIEKAVHIVT